LSITPDCKTRLPALLLVGKPGVVPMVPSDGTVLLRVPEGTACSPDAPATFPMSALPGGWKVRLFALDPEVERWIDFDQDL
jgi:hypothetical protein